MRHSDLLSSKTRGSSSSSVGDVAVSSLFCSTASVPHLEGGSRILTSALSCVFWLSDPDLSAGPSLSAASSFLSPPLASFSFFFLCFSSNSFLTRSISSSNSRFLRASMAAWSILGVQKPVSFRWAAQT